MLLHTAAVMLLMSKAPVVSLETRALPTPSPRTLSCLSLVQLLVLYLSWMFLVLSISLPSITPSAFDFSISSVDWVVILCRMLWASLFVDPFGGPLQSTHSFFSVVFEYDISQHFYVAFEVYDLIPAGSAFISSSLFRSAVLSWIISACFRTIVSFHHVFSLYFFQSCSDVLWQLHHHLIVPLNCFC